MNLLVLLTTKHPSSCWRFRGNTGVRVSDSYNSTLEDKRTTVDNAHTEKNEDESENYNKFTLCSALHASLHLRTSRIALATGNRPASVLINLVPTMGDVLGNKSGVTRTRIVQMTYDKIDVSAFLTCLHVEHG